MIWPNRIRLRILILAFLFSAPLTGVSQDNRWITLESKDKDVAVSFPADFLVQKSESKIRAHAYQDCASLDFSKELINDPAKYVKELQPSFFNKSAKAERGRIGNSVVAKITTDLGAEYSVQFYLGTPKALYSITISSKNRENSALAKVLNSITLNGKPIIVQPKIQSPRPESTILDELTTSQIVTEFLNVPDTAISTIEYKVLKEKTDDNTSYSRDLMILVKPRPTYTDSARMAQIAGTIKVRAEFLHNGQIGSVLIDPTLDRGLAKNVAKVVTKIKFVPAEVNGKPTDMTKVIEYKFSIY